MLTFAIFPIVLFFLGALLVTGLPLAAELQAYYANRGRRSVVCPENGGHAEVEVDHKYALKTAFRNHQQSRLESCTLWPEKGDCGQECLAQVDPSPENVERLLTKWYEGKHCAICTRKLGRSDWQRSRLAVLNQQHRLFELRQMYLDDLQSALENMRPLCWNCHQEERARQAPPPRMLRGERAVLRTALDE
jgi:hypothetical protein